MGSSTDGEADVYAAGVICWRVHRKRLQLLVVHQTSLKAWGWPKGKVDPGEQTPTTAVREVREETGLNVTLAAPLPAESYLLPNGRRKMVSYWVAQVNDDLPMPPRPREIDRTRWVDADKLDGLLTHPTNLVQRDQVVKKFQDNTLATQALIIVRHGHAYPRRAWGKAEAERPLAPAGARQAAALPALISPFGVRKVVSSPWRRCLDTVKIWSEIDDLRLVTKKSLTEYGFRDHPKRAGRLMTELLDQHKSVAVCSHRPVMDALYRPVLEHASKEIRQWALAPSPLLVPGEFIVFHRTKSGVVVAAERHCATTQTKQ